MHTLTLPRLKFFLALSILAMLVTVTVTSIVANEDRATVDVQVFNFGFNSADVTIGVGDTIKWTNTSGFHNVTSTDSPTTFRCGPAGCDQTGGDGNAGSGTWSSSFTFNTPGVYDYTCEIHPGMQGKITVVDLNKVFLPIILSP